MGMFFYPRGGSSFAVRELVARLPARGWEVSLVAGSLGGAGALSHARSFYAGNVVVAHDYTPARDAFLAGRDPMTVPVPMHPSFEPKIDVPDRDFALVDPALVGLQVAAWQRSFAHVAATPDLLHLHHLTPLSSAARRRWPAVPVLVSLHGTELKWLARQDGGGAGGAWAAMMRSWARSASYLTVPSESDRVTAATTLDVDADRIVVLGGGVATDRFTPRRLPDRDRLALWRRWLVADPRGWDESCRPGSVRYTDADLAEFINPTTGAAKPVLLYVGRFTGVKRLALLISVYQSLRARCGSATPPLVIWGGMPGEWEGTHPVTLVRQRAVRGVFFVGMRDHDDLPLGLACSDLLVVASVHESFGQVYVEALAAGVPVVATNTGGPAELVATTGSAACGWLAAPDDGDDLLRCLLEALADPVGRRRRGIAGRALVESRYSWDRVLDQVLGMYACLVP